MRLKIVLDLDNDAFVAADCDGIEVARILRRLADELDDSALGVGSDKIRDVNGNTCGTVTVSP